MNSDIRCLWNMRLPAFTFRILLPSLYLSSWGLLIVGAVLTIAEGPNPFFFLVFASAPGSYLFQLIDLSLADRQP